MKSEILRKLKSRGMAAAVLAILAVAAALLPQLKPALALQVDQTRIMSKRFYNDYHPTYYRVTINYNDPNISTAQMFGALGQNSFIKAIDCHITTAFNASTTNVVTFGTSTAANEIVASGSGTAGIAGGSTGIQHLTTAAGLGLAVTSAADVTLYAKYAQTGIAPASAGSVTCVLEFVPNNDL